MSDTNPYAGMDSYERRDFDKYRLIRMSVLTGLSIALMVCVSCNHEIYTINRYCVEKSQTSAEYRACRLNETSVTREVR